MNKQTPGRIALEIALFISVVLVIILFLSNILFSVDISLTRIIMIGILTLTLSFSAFYYSIKTFIYHKIRVIYKTIHTLKGTKKQTKEAVQPDRDILASVDREVREWAKDKRQEIEQLKQMETYRREFVGNVSHELKTPIFNIQGYIHSLLNGGLEDPKVNKEFLFKAASAVERLCAIVDDLDTISQFESDKLVLDKEKFNIVKLAHDVYESLELQADAENIKLRFNKEYNKPVYVYADKERIRQVMINLVNNSIKYSNPEGGKTEIRFYDMDENVLVEISDNGIGIKEEHLPRLFERFYRIDKSRSRQKGGTGLGLAIVKHIVEAHGEMINVRSNEGEGSTFGFTLKKG